MKIGFEAKRIYHNKTGLGNYGRELIRSMSYHFPQNQYLLYNPKKSNIKIFDFISDNVFERLPNSRLFKILKNYWRQKGIIKDLLNDNIHVYHGISGELPIGLNSTKIKSIVTIHDLIFIHYPHLYSFVDRKIHLLKFKRAAKTANVVIAISYQTKRDIIKYLKINPNKIEVIYQTCNAAFKKKYTIRAKELVKKKYGLPNKFLLNVGTIEKRKNALLIVKSIKNIDIKLFLIGKETSYTNQIKSYIKKHNIEDKVVFLKNINNQELAIIYQLATIFIYPSFFEGFGIPIIESMYCKTPVITSKNGVFPESGGKHSIYVDPNNEEELESNIILLLNDDNLRNKISEKNYQFVQKFSAKEMAKNYNEIYNKIIIK